MTARGGFTLLELAVVLVIAGIVATIVLPRLDLGAVRLDAAERQVSLMIAAGQQRALTRQHDIHLRFDVAGSRLLMHEDPDNDGEVDPGEREDAIPLEEGVVFGRAAASVGPPGAAPVSFREDSRDLPTLTFHRSGSASQAGGFYMAREDGVSEPGQVRALMVERATGRVVRYFNDEEGKWQRHTGG